MKCPKTKLVKLSSSCFTSLYKSISAVSLATAGASLSGRLSRGIRIIWFING